MKYKDLLLIKFLKSMVKQTRTNAEVQKIYDSSEEYESMLIRLQEYNLSNPNCFLASGQSCYFNDQIDQNGISNMKIDEETKEDCKFIASCFGKILSISDNNFPILYTTLLGTTEFNYAMQTFPAGVFEDVFQCSVTHNLPLQPYVGENEVDYYVRVMDNSISSSNGFPLEKKEEVLLRARRIACVFCNGKNRIYLIPFDNVLGNKASFGDVKGLRDGSVLDIDDKLKELPTFLELLKQEYIPKNTSGIEAYSNPNMTSEYGVAIYGSILSKGISFIEVERIYTLMQRKARELGYSEGDVIPEDILNILSKDTKSL